MMKMAEDFMVIRAARWMVVAAVVMGGMARGEEEMMEMASTTRPTTRPGEGGPGGGMMFQRLREAADELGLSPEQKGKIREIAENARRRAQKEIEDARGDRQKVRRQLGEIMQEAFRQVREVLTPEQQRQWREMIEREGGPMPPRRLGGLGLGKESVKAETTTRAAENKEVDPSKLELKKLDGKALSLSSMSGRPLVLVFGSYSCPNFREHAKEIDELQRKYSTKANFVVVYTKEAHPAGGWEVQRNKDAEISVPAHKDEGERLAAARQAKTKLGLSMPMVVDSMEDEAVKAFDAFPNGCVVLGRDGKIAGRQKWAEARGIREMVEEITAPKPATRSATAEGISGR